MLIVEQSVLQFDEDDIYKKIERAGRTCYKSEDRITEDSHVKFIRNLVAREHYSVLEHGSINMIINGWRGFSDLIPSNLLGQFIGIKSSREDFILVSANVRAWRELLVESPIPHLIEKYPIFFGDITKKPIKAKFEILGPNLESMEMLLSPYVARQTFEIVTTRDISHQIVRHRTFSVSQESQRYCNYSKNNIAFIIPKAIKDNAVQEELWNLGRIRDEEEYRLHIKSGMKPEVARTCLPNATATTLIVTASLWAWNHFIQLRTARGAQEEIRDLATSIHKILFDKYGAELGGEKWLDSVPN